MFYPSKYAAYYYSDIDHLAKMQGQAIAAPLIKNTSAFLPRCANCEAPSSLRNCDPP
jgi:hypothetical protein